MRMGMKTSGVRAAGAAVAAAILLAILPGAALGAELSVSEQLDLSVNRARLTLLAAPGESNQVTISGSGGKFTVVDLGATLTAGPGCSGGGVPGTAALCVMHPPSAGETVPCGHDCFKTAPGTRWANAVIVDLGDGDDSLDAHTLSGSYENAIPMTVAGGPGDDSITTGTGSDLIDPGAGADVVHSGAGHDSVIAGPAPDGNDLYDLGGESGAGFDKVDYSSWEEPVHLQGDVVEGDGERDTLVGVDYVVGGAGDDVLTWGGDQGVLEGGPGSDRLEGGEGSDTLLGGPGNDSLSGNGGRDFMLGGDGDDRYSGGEGNDQISDQELLTDGENLPLPSRGDKATNGDDVAEGGGGDDSIDLGPGDDRAEGGTGNDEISGDTGADILDGDRGNDAIAGDAGPDELVGGLGSDRILAGHVEDLLYHYEPRATAEDSWSDTVRCGPGRDRAQINPWDFPSGCERASIVHAVQFHGITRESPGTAQIAVEVLSPGRISVAGVQGSQIAPQARRMRGIGEVVAFLTIRAGGRTLASLRRNGRVKVRVGVSFRPRGGIERTEVVGLWLALRRR